MNILTKKINKEYYRKDANTIMFNSETDYFAIQKLGKLEDLEKELGCPLEVIIEATRKDIIDRKGIRHSVLYGGLYLFSLEDDELTNIFSLKDYRKSWWLVGDKR